MVVYIGTYHNDEVADVYYGNVLLALIVSAIHETIIILTICLCNRYQANHRIINRATITFGPKFVDSNNID